MQLVKDQNKLLVYIEGRKRKQFVGLLHYDLKEDNYIFTYEKKYLTNNTSIPLGPDIPLTKVKHESQGKLFPSFIDRIPSKRNPAYEDYCAQQGISPKEKNPIILLGAIGRRGPSSFVFEPEYCDEFNVQKEITIFRKTLNLSLNDLALAFNMNVLTLQRVEKGKTHDPNIYALLKIYLTTPGCFEEILILTGRKLHHETFQKLQNWIEKSYKSKQADKNKIVKNEKESF
jgi:HipA-like protein